MKIRVFMDFIFILFFVSFIFSLVFKICSRTSKYLVWEVSDKVKIYHYFIFIYLVLVMNIWLNPVDYLMFLFVYFRWVMEGIFE